jgi:hypothetical protein
MRPSVEWLHSFAEYELLRCDSPFSVLGIVKEKAYNGIAFPFHFFFTLFSVSVLPFRALDVMVLGEMSQHYRVHIDFFGLLLPTDGAIWGSLQRIIPPPNHDDCPFDPPPANGSAKVDLPHNDSIEDNVAAERPSPSVPDATHEVQPDEPDENVTQPLHNLTYRLIFYSPVLNKSVEYQDADSLFAVSRWIDATKAQFETELSALPVSPESRHELLRRRRRPQHTHHNHQHDSAPHPAHSPEKVEVSVEDEDLSHIAEL